MPSSALLSVVPILGAEPLPRLPFGAGAPELLLYPVVLLLAYRYGLRAGLASALLAGAYLMLVGWDLGSPPGSPERRWRAALLALTVAAAATTGHLRSRIDRLRGRAQAAAEAASARTHRILDSLGDGFLMLDPDWRLTYVNRAAQALLRRSHDELVGREAREIFPPSIYLDFYRKYRARAKKQGSVRFEASTADETRVEVFATSSSEGVAMYFRDVTEHRRHEERLRSMTLIDELTGLYNRRGFFALAEQQRKLAERKGRGLLLVFADLDHLKRINDTFGHTAGDQALFEMAAVLRHTFRETDVVARIGGDEFAALILESEAGTASLVLRRLEANIREANAQGTLPFELSLSVGAASYDDASALPIEELLSLADHRMYEQKRGKRRSDEP